MKKILIITVIIFTITSLYSQFTGPTSGVVKYENNYDGMTRVEVNNSVENSNSFSSLYVRTGLTGGFSIEKFGTGLSTSWSSWDGISLANYGMFRTDRAVSGLIFTTGGSNAPLIFGTNDSEKFRITPNGNVGIGTSNPSSKLSVNGGIESTEVQVKATIADYVFADDYSLMPLEEVEQFIINNKHLPNVFSERDQIDNNGNIPLGEVTMSLLEKIEELILHVIDLNKRIKELEARE